jgi:hypothetical protein
MAKPTPINQDLTNLAISERVVKLLESNQYKADDSADMFPVSSFELLNANWNKAYFYKLIIAKAKNDGRNCKDSKYAVGV